MEKYLIVSTGYPSQENLYNNAFIHARVKNYKKLNINIEIFICDKSLNSLQKYEYEGVEVNKGNYEVLKEFLLKYKFRKILIHFGYKKMVKTIIENAKNTPLLMWVHGVEALGWYRRLFAFEIKRPHRFIGYILLNTRQLLFMHNLIKNKSVDITFIFVSEWMKKILEKDSLSKNKIKKYMIIPNVIDSNIFKYQKKSKEDRLKVLSIRPYMSKKYANDLSVKAVLELSSKSFFKDLTFTFYGDGRMFDDTLKPLKKFNNVKIFKKFLKQDEIIKVHKENGIMLIPTRQDAQGVSMCEAMSSGLVPVTSMNTAIPEYVSNNEGFLTNNYKELAQAIEKLYYDPKLFEKLSKNASKKIKLKCDTDNVIKKEIELIKS